MAPIIIVGNSSTMCKIISWTLQALGRPIIATSNGTFAVQMAIQNKPALCIIDIDMSGDAPGEAIAQALRKIQVKVLLYSTLEKEELQRVAFEIECEWHHKDVDLVAFREHVRDLISKKYSAE